MKRENSLVRAGAVLVISGFTVKVLSAAYRIPLTRMLGAYAMGRYSTVFNLFMPFYALATAGIAPCLSRFTAEYFAKKQADTLVSLRTKALKLYVFLAVILTALFMLVSGAYSAYMGDEFIFTGSFLLCPSIIFAAAEGVYKGYTQGKMDMMPTAKANILESVTKTVSGLCSVYYITNFVSSGSANFAVYACLISVTFSGMLCVIYLAFSQRGETKPAKKINISSLSLLKISFPIALSALVVSVVSFFDTAVCIPIIKNIPYQTVAQSFKGASFKGATDLPMYLFGVYQGMVMTVFNLVPAVLSSMGTAWLPVVAKAQALNDKQQLQKAADKLFMLTAGISVPMCLYIYLFRRDIMEFLFSTTPSQTQVSACLLAILAPFGVFACFTFVFSSIFHGCKRSDISFKILVAASVIKCVSSVVLVSFWQINIKGLAISGGIFYTVIFVLSAFNIHKVGIKFSFFKLFLIPVAASFGAMAAVELVFEFAFFSLPLMLRIFFTGIIYSLSYFMIVIITGFSVDI